MINTILSTPIFGICLTLLVYILSMYLCKVLKLKILNPILLSMFSIIIMLTAGRISYETYAIGADYISYFLGPITVMLAVPMYKNYDLLKKNALPILIGVGIGSMTSIASVFALGSAMTVEHEITLSLLPKSITTPLGIASSEMIGGIVPVTVLAIIITGITGAIAAPLVVKVFNIRHPIAKGIAIGTSSHALGTTKAFELGEVEGAMSSLSIAVAGIMTTVLIPVFLHLLVGM